MHESDDIKARCAYNATLVSYTVQIKADSNFSGFFTRIRRTLLARGMTEEARRKHKGNADTNNRFIALRAAVG